jgi:hypothetical protein
VSDVQPSLLTRISALVALLVSMSPVLAHADDEVIERTTEKTTVILVEQTPEKPWETPAWAYPERGLTFFPEGPGKGKDCWAVGGSGRSPPCSRPATFAAWARASASMRGSRPSSSTTSSAWADSGPPWSVPSAWA